MFMHEIMCKLFCHNIIKVTALSPQITQKTFDVVLKQRPNYSYGTYSFTHFNLGIVQLYNINNININYCIECDISVYSIGRLIGAFLSSVM